MIRVTDDMRDPDTPDEVQIRAEPRPPAGDPTLGIGLAAPPSTETTPLHRLVTIGDSLTHGFMSAAIYRTEISYPALIARELGWEDFAYPTYEPPNGPGGLPFDLERFARRLEGRYGERLDWWESLSALRWGRRYMDAIEDYWERGPGATDEFGDTMVHNLAVYGWDLRDALSLTSEHLRARVLEAGQTDNLLAQAVAADAARAGLRVLGPATGDGAPLTAVQAAAALGEDGSVEDGSGDGIETLVIMLGANNALTTVTDLRVVWSGDDYADLDAKAAYTVWRPSHFEAELGELVAALKRVRARHVILATVPNVTIAPIARGVGDKVRRGSRYFPYYTRPWVPNHQFDPADDEHITGQQARAVDSAIAQYNEAIESAVKEARRESRDWYVFELGGLLDRLAARRYLQDPGTRPDWWTPYELPDELARLSPVPDTKFFSSGPWGRTQGGIFSLDGVHPTTAAYGVVAQELIKIMELAGVQFRHAGGTPRPSPVRMDFEKLLREDTLLSNPPAGVTSSVGLIGWVDQALDVVKRVLRFGKVLTP